MPPQVRLIPGSARKICQLTGEWDRQRGTHAHNRTETRFGVIGTDLGSSFEHDGRLWFLFGDTWPDPELGDSAAWTTDRAAEPGIGLHFVADGSRFRVARVRTADGRPVSTRAFEVPTAGFSAGGHMYVFRTTDHFREGGREVMGRSVLTRAVNGDPTDLRCLYDFSVIPRAVPRGICRLIPRRARREVRRGGRFVNVSCVVVDGGLPGLPFRGPALLAWGSGRYRASDVHLACIPLDRVEDERAWRYCCAAGRGPGGPDWSEDEADAVPLFPHPEVGELSVTWNAPLGVWLLLYNAGTPRGINARVARHPWGPWSPPEVVFDPGWPGTGYGHFMHVQDRPDGLSDPGREHEWGGEYGPYVIDRYTRALPGGRAAVYFTMSTWNPYNVVEMAVVLELAGDG